MLGRVLEAIACACRHCDWVVGRKQVGAVVELDDAVGVVVDGNVPKVGRRRGVHAAVQRVEVVIASFRVHPVLVRDGDAEIVAVDRVHDNLARGSTAVS